MSENKVLSVRNPIETENLSNDSNDIKYKKIGDTTYKVVSNYIGKNSLLDIVKSAIKRDIESGNY